MKGKFGNVAFIDVDGDRFENIIIIDASESEDSSSESDYFDFEHFKGCFGKIQQWEKVCRRLQYVRNGQSGLEDQTSGSGSRNDTPPGVGENASQQYAETPASSGSSGSSLQKQNSPAFEIDSDNYQDDTCLNRGTKRPFVESEDKVGPESFSRSKYGPTAEAPFFHVQADVIFGRERFVEVPLSRNRNEELSWTPSNFDPYPSDLQHGNTVANGEEKLQSKESSEEKPVEKDVNPVDVEVRTLFDESTSVKTPLDGIRVVSSKRFCDGNSFQNNGTQIRQSLSMAEQSNINSMHNRKKYDESVHVQVVDAIVSCKKDMIIDREKFKETDEYKQAMEEEWASRQRELKIQAEEAQRLRKRRKSESMRVLDMERRKKQRLEEMRETQKKDEENLTLKEQLRMEVRKELSRLEISCIDMASLLCSLGIPVGGGFYPLSNEIHVAYKRALLRFHPDRASKTDIRQQVEAEEKFKLITRMKEKFLQTSCH